MNRTASERLFAEALKYIPGGVNSPVRAFRAVGGNPFFVNRASGSKFWPCASATAAAAKGSLGWTNGARGD